MNIHTPMATKMLGSLALLVIAGAGWMFVVGPATNELAVVREQTQAARDQNDLMTLQLLKLEQQAAALDETRAEKPRPWRRSSPRPRTSPACSSRSTPQPPQRASDPRTSPRSPRHRRSSAASTPPVRWRPPLRATVHSPSRR